MPNLRNGSKEDSNAGSFNCESDILPLSYRAPGRVHIMNIKKQSERKENIFFG